MKILEFGSLNLIPPSSLQLYKSNPNHGERGEQNSNVMLPNWKLILEIEVSVDLEPEVGRIEKELHHMIWL